jgi:hypothetical protein
MPDDELQEIEVPLVWLGLEDMPIFTANQFLGQVQDDEFFIAIGQATPPPITGRTADERRAQAKAITAVPAKTLCRLGMTRHRVEELIRVLTNTLEIHDKQKAPG